jgi:large subunit ribosomal protein L18
MYDRDLKGKKTDNAFELGKRVAAKLLEKNVSKVVFDRNGYRFIGRVKSMAD